MAKSLNLEVAIFTAIDPLAGEGHAIKTWCAGEKPKLPRSHKTFRFTS